jgi:hypothetical protein
MPDCSSLDDLKPLEERAVQPYFSNRLQLADVIGWCLRQCGPADIMISTFSTSEEFLRRLYRFKASGLVRRCDLFCDLRAIRKTMVLYDFIRSVCSSVFLCENHSKVVLISDGVRYVSVITSQNQTRGNRYECGLITTDRRAFSSLSSSLSSLSEKSLSLDDLQR